MDASKERAAVSPTVTVIAGGIAGLTSRFVIAPFDVIKIRLQLQPGLGTTYFGAIHAARKIVAEEGPTALWKGNIPAELMYVLYGMIQFLMYRQLHVLLGNSELPSKYHSFVAGACAGTCGSVLTYPL